jgi:hypothetical protein
MKRFASTLVLVCGLSLGSPAVADYGMDNAFSLMMRMMLTMMNIMMGGGEGMNAWSSFGTSFGDPWDDWSGGKPWNSLGSRGWPGSWYSPWLPAFSNRSGGAMPWGMYGMPWNGPIPGAGGTPRVNLNGLWLSSGGDVLDIRGNRFELGGAGQVAIYGTLMTDGHRLVTHTPQLNITRRYLMRRYPGGFVLQDPRGEVLTFQRISRETIARYAVGSYAPRGRPYGQIAESIYDNLYGDTYGDSGTDTSYGYQSPIAPAQDEYSNR